MSSSDQLDDLLARHFQDDMRRHEAADAHSVEAVLTALAGRLPRQRWAWRLWPAALLDWNFAPAWPRLTVLASCAVVGFAIGVASPILHAHGSGAAPAQTDIGAILTEPEPLTGALP